MPKLPAMGSRQSRVSGQPSQVAGALIPDNTQHSRRGDVGARIGRKRGDRHWWVDKMEAISAMSHAAPQVLNVVFGSDYFTL